MKKTLIFTVGLLILLMSILVNCAAAAPIQYSGNGHYYDAIHVSGSITWNEAKTAAESSSYSDITGHLATITSQEENDFIANNFDESGCWLGGFQPANTPSSLEPDGGWQWVTGETWSYTHWASNQPDNSGGEHALHFLFWSPSFWNDLPYDPTPTYPVNGYIVEYEPTTTSVPEFPSMVMPVAAVLGMLVIFGRKKV